MKTLRENIFLLPFLGSTSLQAPLPLPCTPTSYTQPLRQSHGCAKAGGDGEPEAVHDPAASHSSPLLQVDELTLQPYKNRPQWYKQFVAKMKITNKNNPGGIQDYLAGWAWGNCSPYLPGNASWVWPMAYPLSWLQVYFLWKLEHYHCMVSQSIAFNSILNSDFLG